MCPERDRVGGLGRHRLGAVPTGPSIAAFAPLVFRTLTAGIRVSARLGRVWVGSVLQSVPGAKVLRLAAVASWMLAVAAGAHPTHARAQEARLQTTPVDVLIEAEWLRDHIDDVVVIHAERRQGEFEREHIAGAVPLGFDAIAWEGEEGWIAEFRPVGEIVGVLRALGIRNDSKVVIYGSGMTTTARTWLTFDWLGLGDRAFVLDGGAEAWKRAGGEMASGPLVRSIPAGDLEVDGAVDFRVSAAWIAARLDSGSLALLDARPDDEYTGEDGGLGGRGRPGHIPGARQLYWEELMDPSDQTRFRSREEMGAILARHGAGPEKLHVAYCMIGMRASVVYMVARMHGLDVLFYDGSWRDWGDRHDLPAALGPDTTR